MKLHEERLYRVSPHVASNLSNQNHIRHIASNMSDRVSLNFAQIKYNTLNKVCFGNTQTLHACYATTNKLISIIQCNRSNKLDLN